MLTCLLRPFILNSNSVKKNSAWEKNDEFDCVLDRGGSLDFFECKRFDRKMTRMECEAEECQVKAVPGASIGVVGFVCTGGFDFESSDYSLVTGGDLYAENL